MISKQGSDELPGHMTAKNVKVVIVCNDMEKVVITSDDDKSSPLLTKKFGVDLPRHNAKKLLWIAGLILLLIPMAVLIVLYTTRNDLQQGTEDLSSNSPVNQGIDSVLLIAKKLRFVSRKEWLAQPSGSVDKLKLPVPYVVITHTASENCSSQAECVFFVRNIQTFHIESRNWSDIAYNFLIGGDGSVYVGRGWDIVGAHTKGYNVNSIGIAFIGTYNDILPPKRSLEAAQLLLQMGVELKNLASNYKLFGHRQLSPTLSPGDKLFGEISTWPHFSTEL